MERVSEFMDGELNVDAAEREITRLKSDAALREGWDTYHLIGDAMRGGVPALNGFNARFSERLAAEPTVLAPRSRPVRKMQTYALSAAASVAAVAVVGWMGFAVMKAEAPAGKLAATPAASVQPLQAVAPQLAQPQAVETAQATAPSSASSALVAAPAEHVHEYMLAHSGISPSTQIQGVTTYIRTVSAGDQ